jgi:hypothetical protein
MIIDIIYKCLSYLIIEISLWDLLNLFIYSPYRFDLKGNKIILRKLILDKI